MYLLCVIHMLVAIILMLSKNRFAHLKNQYGYSSFVAKCRSWERERSPEQDRATLVPVKASQISESGR